MKLYYEIIPNNYLNLKIQDTYYITKTQIFFSLKNIQSHSKNIFFFFS